jgi:hypothetical protein
MGTLSGQMEMTDRTYSWWKPGDQTERYPCFSDQIKSGNIPSGPPSAVRTRRSEISRIFLSFDQVSHQ